MIRYDLRCADGHDFDSWFASASAFDDLSARGLLSCAICGSSRVEKRLMAPAVRPEPAAKPGAGPRVPPLSAPRDQREAALAALRKQIEAKSDYVGLSFAAEARRMHEGEVPSRPIHGEAKIEDAKKLLEDGVPVAPLPFLPKRKTN
ncbi:DUF1178 family protein [Pseudoroseicyclus aestuarii]|uniref:DUF1178 family protein n=1 Tax=Pseudoroseicyclus aestuarii TaxID=1795041 RepID=A0A318T0Y4_9RHOB|nr:DUF1178 family protein [Pseudoroseicyclus aestuarii]PYE85647.1 hypothetical protein DFP88_101316 [Pseudoroseicyclus aestuarii]